jgi:hypothetical protein
MGLKHVLRRLLRLPMFTALTVVTLGLGIGANSAIFSVIDGVLLKPLPYRQAGELLAVNHAAPGVNLPNAGIAAFLYYTYRDEARSFQDIGMWNMETTSVTGLAEPEEIISLDVTDGVLPILGIQPALGRLFTKIDDSPDGGKTGHPHLWLLAGEVRRRAVGHRPDAGAGRAASRDHRRAAGDVQVSRPPPGDRPAAATRSEQDLPGAVQLSRDRPLEAGRHHPRGERRRGAPDSRWRSRAILRFPASTPRCSRKPASPRSCSR